MNHTDTYKDFLAHYGKLSDIECALEVLHWDMEVNMPSGSGNFRGRSLSTLTGLHHQLAVSKDLRRMLDNLKTAKGLTEIQDRNVQLAEKEYNRIVKLPERFVTELSEASTAAHEAWLHARGKNDYAVFEPHMQNIINLKKRQAELIGYEDHPYDALLDDYEPDMRVAVINPLFVDLKEKLIPLLDKIKKSKTEPPPPLLGIFPRARQLELSRIMASELGFNFQKGRMDLSAHPFSISFNPNDVRITTRIRENDLMESLSSTIHEVGHALYEQGINLKYFGQPAGSDASLGIHESQSRLWENNVGRSEAFVEAWFDTLLNFFPEQLREYDVKDFFHAINQVHPTFIRTSADEVTYHFHIIIRYEIELAIMEGKVEASGLRDLWNRKYREYLKLEVPDDNQGILQDLHWAHGSIGYFPTYSMGSLYAAQFFRQAEKDIPELENQIRHKRYKPLLKWLRQKIHRHGKVYSAEHLCESVTGEKLNPEYFMDYAERKFAQVYGFKL